VTTKSAAPAIDIVTAVKDPQLIGDILSPAQEALLRSIYGLTVPEEQVPLVERCTGRPPQPGIEYRESAIIAGRRSGKSDKIASNICLYEAMFRHHRISAGERAIVLLLAQNVRQAGVVNGYIRGKLERSPILQQHVLAMRSHEVDLDNGVTIAVYPSSFRSIRGLSVIACVCDEIGYWWTETEYSNPDVEVIRAVRPAMATFPHAKLILVSSPYAKSGVLWDAWQSRHDDPDTLVWHAPTALMNPTVRAAFLEKERARDPEVFAREYLAEFTDAVSSFLPSDAIEACTIRGRNEVAQAPHAFRYVCALDAAYVNDTFAMAVAHHDRTRDVVVIDHVAGWKGSKQSPVRLTDVLPQLKAIAARYGIGAVTADQYGVEPLRHALKSIGLEINERTFTAGSKADMFSNLKSLVVERRIELLDHAESLRELRGLEVELMPGGQTRVGHAHRASAHDDFATAIALAAFETRQDRGPRPVESIEELMCGEPYDTIREFGPSPSFEEWMDPIGYRRRDAHGLEIIAEIGQDGRMRRFDL